MQRATGATPPSPVHRLPKKKGATRRNVAPPHDGGRRALLLPGGGNASSRFENSATVALVRRQDALLISALTCGREEPMPEHGRLVRIRVTMEESDIRRLISAALLSSFVTVFALPALAQTSPSTPAPTGPADCKTTELWDEATKTCKPR